MVKKEKQVVNATEETTVDITQNLTPNEVAPEKPAKSKTTRKTKSDTPKKTTSRSKAAKTAEVKEVIKEVIKVVTPEVFVQFAGNELAASTLVNQAQDNWIAAGNDVNAIESIKIYIKPEEDAAYYVINETETGKIDF